MNDFSDLDGQILMKRQPLLSRVLVGLCTLLALLPTVGGCQDSKPKMLGIEGYNYTDRYIHTFDVGGQGGGNVYQSTATSGGGGTYCCIGYNPRRKLPIQMKVKWTFGYEEDAQGNIVVPNETHEAVAELRGPVPADPRFLEVHFMPDLTVQLRITDDRSPPLLVIDRNKAKTP